MDEFNQGDSVLSSSFREKLNDLIRQAYRPIRGPGVEDNAGFVAINPMKEFAQAAFNRVLLNSTTFANASSPGTSYSWVVPDGVEYVRATIIGPGGNGGSVAVGETSESQTLNVTGTDGNVVGSVYYTVTKHYPGGGGGGGGGCVICEIKVNAGDTLYGSVTADNTTLFGSNIYQPTPPGSAIVVGRGEDGATSVAISLSPRGGDGGVPKCLSYLNTVNMVGTTAVYPVFYAQGKHGQNGGTPYGKEFSPFYIRARGGRGGNSPCGLFLSGNTSYGDGGDGANALAVGSVAGGAGQLGMIMLQW